MSAADNTRDRCISLGTFALAIGLSACGPQDSGRGSGQGPGQDPGELSATDAEAIRALDQAYGEAWLGEDAEAAVMSLLTEDAVIIPHQGDPVHKGREAIRAFWFPPAGPPVTVEEFVRTPAEVGGAGTVGWVRGRFRLVLSSSEFRVQAEGNYLSIARKDESGSWRIARLIWNDQITEL